MVNNSSSSLASSNGTSDWQLKESPIYQLVASVMVMLVMVLVVFSLGCTTEVKKLWDNIKRPWGITVGMISQFGLLPLVAYILAISLVPTTVQKVAILILGCSPGGSLSNLFTYWVDGDMNLSITMTACSTAAALGMMPLCLYIYSYSWELEDGVEIPYQIIGTSLLILIIPVACGTFVNYRWPKHSKIIAKVSNNCFGDGDTELSVVRWHAPFIFELSTFCSAYQIYKKYLAKREEEKAPEPHIQTLDVFGSKLNAGFEKEEDGPVRSRMENSSKTGQFQQTEVHEMTSFE
uniref:Uncharacterized protein n=1 Tax=Sphaerodactylus townsendi TaxID=933632 RepID=A0ACB8E911_9SAUR